MAQDGLSLSTQAALMAGPLRHREWPLAEAAAETVLGQAALLEGDLDVAQRLLESAVRRHARYPAPAFYADPRVALAHLHRLRGDRAIAWNTWLPVLHEVTRDGTPGRLLLEPQPLVHGCWPCARPMLPRRKRCSRCNKHCRRGTARRPMPPARRCQRRSPRSRFRLTEREREVLDLVAQGLPNKVLARQLSLSPHTVKRHLANILDKLDCDNRGQAANLWRRSAAGPGA